MAKRKVNDTKNRPLFRFICCVFLTASVFAAGCITKLGRDPLERWSALGSAYRTHCPFGQAVVDDYQNYIQKLPAKERFSVSDFRIGFFESGFGERAVTIKVDSYGMFGGKEWTHILIYDKAGKRIKNAKYLSGRFLS